MTALRAASLKGAVGITALGLAFMAGHLVTGTVFAARTALARALDPDR